MIDDAARIRYNNHWRDAQEEINSRMDLQTMQRMVHRWHRLWMEQYISETYDVILELY